MLVRVPATIIQSDWRWGGGGGERGTTEIRGWQRGHWVILFSSMLFLIRHTVGVCWTYRARSEHHPKPIHVISWGSSMHHFNSTTCQTKGHGPERTLCKSVCRGEREERSGREDRRERDGRRGGGGRGGVRGEEMDNTNYHLHHQHILPPKNTHTYLPCPIHDFIQLGDHKFRSMVQFSSRNWCGDRGNICLLTAIRHQVVWASGSWQESPG